MLRSSRHCSRGSDFRHLSCTANFHTTNIHSRTHRQQLIYITIAGCIWALATIIYMSKKNYGHQLRHYHKGTILRIVNIIRCVEVNVSINSMKKEYLKPLGIYVVLLQSYISFWSVILLKTRLYDIKINVE